MERRPRVLLLLLLLPGLLRQAQGAPRPPAPTVPSLVVYGLPKILNEDTKLYDGPTVKLPYKSSCPPGCHINGVCNEELGRMRMCDVGCTDVPCSQQHYAHCDCPRHFKGPDCQTVAPNIREICYKYGFTLSQCRSASPCFNSCNGRGKCIAGFCHCQPGFWGMDCSLSYSPDKKEVLLLEGQNYVPRKDAVRIYVYELPPNITAWFNFRRLDRPLHMLFWQRLMSAGIRTTNGYEADYYFIPICTRTLIAPELLQWVIPYIRRAFPWWNLDNGHRHLAIHTGDLGYQEWHPVVQESMGGMLSNISWMTHWGLHTYHNATKWRVADRPGKDIVIPVMITTQGFNLSPLNPLVAAANEAKGRTKRKGTFFFAGRICGDRKPPQNGTCSPHRPDYSAMVRQRVYEMHHKHPGFKVVPSTKAYLKDISSHKFCLAPTGGGHGKRNILVTFMGCIPVTITDNVYQPFEPEMSWKPFSVPVAEADIPRLPEILESIPEEAVEKMQSRLHCAAQHMYYSSSLGGIIGEDGRYDAFETIIEILRVRKKHPDLPAEKYAQVDERWRRFINCDLGDPDPKVLCAQGHERFHPDMPTCTECHNKVLHMRTSSSFFGWAGGMVCCSETELAHCPRIWK